jgi:hypothetical protein
MPVEIDELLVNATVQPSGESAAAGAAAAGAPAAAALTALRDLQRQLLRDDERTRASGNDA